MLFPKAENLSIVAVYWVCLVVMWYGRWQRCDVREFVVVVFTVISGAAYLARRGRGLRLIDRDPRYAASLASRATPPSDIPQSSIKTTTIVDSEQED